MLRFIYQPLGVSKKKSMKAIIILLAMIFATSLEVRSQGHPSSPCKGLEETIQDFHMCGVGYVQTASTLSQCYLESREFEKGIRLSVDMIGDVDEFRIGAAGWSKQLREFYSLKYGKAGIEKELSNAEIWIQGLAFLIQMEDSQFLLGSNDWSGLISVSVKVFGDEIPILPRNEIEFERFLISNVMSGEVEVEEVERYFSERWKGSILYSEMID